MGLLGNWQAFKEDQYFKREFLEIRKDLQTPPDLDKKKDQQSACR